MSTPSMELVSEDGRHYGPFPLAKELEPLLVTGSTWLPPKLQPANFSPPPEYTVTDLKKIFEHRYGRLGAGVMLVDEDCNFVIAQHTPSSKNPSPVDSIPSETSRFWQNEEGEVVVETALETAARCLSEELDIDSGELLLPRIRSWGITHWPVGSSPDNQEAIIAPIIIFGFEEKGEVGQAIRSFAGTDEIDRLYRLNPVEILNYPEKLVRRGLVGALSTIMLQDVMLSLRGAFPLLGDIDLIHRPGFATRMRLEDMVAGVSESAQDVKLSNDLLRRTVFGPGFRVSDTMMRHELLEGAESAVQTWPENGV